MFKKNIIKLAVFAVLTLPLYSQAQNSTVSSIDYCDSVGIPVIVTTSPGMCMEGSSHPRTCPMITSYRIDCLSHYRCPDGSTGVYRSAQIYLRSLNHAIGYCSNNMGYSLAYICLTQARFDITEIVELTESDNECLPMTPTENEVELEIVNED